MNNSALFLNDPSVTGLDLSFLPDSSEIFYHIEDFNFYNYRTIYLLDRHAPRVVKTAEDIFQGADSDVGIIWKPVESREFTYAMNSFLRKRGNGLLEFYGETACLILSNGSGPEGNSHFNSVHMISQRLEAKIAAGSTYDSLLEHAEDKLRVSEIERHALEIEAANLKLRLREAESQADLLKYSIAALRDANSDRIRLEEQNLALLGSQLLKK